MREREDDIIIVAKAFLHNYGVEHSKPGLTFAPWVLTDGKRVTAKMVQDARRRHRGKITSAALELGISRPTLYELMEKLKIGKEA